MVHALAAFIQGQTQDRQWRNADLVRESGLSKQVVSKYLNDRRDVLNRLPARSTVEGFAQALRVSPEFLLGKAIESLGLGYTSGDFVNAVSDAADRDLVAEIERRLALAQEPPAGPH